MRKTKLIGIYIMIIILSNMATFAQEEISGKKLVERKAYSDIYYDLNSGNYTMQLYPKKVNMLDSDGIYKPYEKVTNVISDNDSLEISWRNNTVTLDYFVINSDGERQDFKGLFSSVQDDLKFTTNLSMGRGYYYYDHRMDKKSQPVKFGYGLLTNGIKCRYAENALVCGEQRIDFSDAITKQGINVEVINNDVLFSGEDLSYIDPIISLDDDISWHGELEYDENCESCEHYHFEDQGNSTNFWVGRDTSGGYHYTYRDYVRWHTTDIESYWNITNVELVWWPYAIYGGSSYDTVYFYQMIDTDVVDWTPNNGQESADLFDEIGTGTFYASETNPSEDEWNVISLGSSANSRIESDIDNDYSFNLGLKGIETTNVSIVAIRGKDSISEPYLNITYTIPPLADLEIVDIIPIQVIPNVDMVKGKSGYVRVIVRNNGPNGATAQVNVTFDGSALTSYNPASGEKYIADQSNATFDFNFKPDVIGNKIISAEVGII